jgi:hypothetical protein
MRQGNEAHAPGDRSRILLADDDDIRYWTFRLGCTEPGLRHAVAVVGRRAEAVNEYLSASHRSPIRF